MDTGIKDLLQLYFDASFESDGEKMSKVFHPGAHVYGHTEDSALKDMDREFFINVVGSLPPGSANASFSREDEILSVDFTGENTAVALVKLRLGDIVFTDVLSLIRLDGKWTVISKLYSGVSAQQSQAKKTRPGRRIYLE